MAKSVFFFGEGHPEGDPKRRDLLGGKGAGLAEMTSLGLPRSYAHPVRSCPSYQLHSREKLKLLKWARPVGVKFRFTGSTYQHDIYHVKCVGKFGLLSRIYA